MRHVRGHSIYSNNFVVASKNFQGVTQLKTVSKGVSMAVNQICASNCARYLEIKIVAFA